MTSNALRIRALAVVLVALAPVSSYAQIGNFTGTSTPTVVVSPTTLAPQTPVNVMPPIGQPGLSGPQSFIATRPVGAPRVTMKR
jgi:hypothetical protein